MWMTCSERQSRRWMCIVEGEKHFPFAGSLLKCRLHPGLGQAGGSSTEFRLDVPHSWVILWYLWGSALTSMLGLEAEQVLELRHSYQECKHPKQCYSQIKYISLRHTLCNCISTIYMKETMNSSYTYKFEIRIFTFVIHMLHIYIYYTYTFEIFYTVIPILDKIL